MSVYTAHDLIIQGVIDASDDSPRESNSRDEVDVSEEANEESKPEVFGPKLYNLDDKVNVWSDYLKLHLHPKSVQIVEEYTHNK